MAEHLDHFFQQEGMITICKDKELHVKARLLHVALGRKDSIILLCLPARI